MADSRKTAKTVEARLSRTERGVELRAPGPGYWRAPPKMGVLVRPGDGIGEMEVLGTVTRLCAPKGAFGVVTEIEAPELARAPVDHGTVILVLDPEGVVGGTAAAEAADAAGSSGPVFETPMGGRYYAKPSPDADPFVRAGDTVSAGQTVALIEVMKTFNRVKYDGEPAKVVRVVPTDGDDVELGDVLLELEGG